VPSPQPVEHDPRLASFALVRPDGILAVRGRGQNIDKLVSYLQQIGGVPSIPSRFRPEACRPANPSFQATSADKANSVSYSRGPLLTGPAEHIKRMARTGQPDRQFHAPPTIAVFVNDARGPRLWSATHRSFPQADRPAGI
jgi:hypothetical protein